jgi:hypothetical protein
MYPTRNLIAGASLLQGDPVIRVQRAALAVAVMLSSSNVSPMTTILASLLFAVLAGWARAHNWTRASKTLSWQNARPLTLGPSAGIFRRSPASIATHPARPMDHEPLSADIRRLLAAIACAPHMLHHGALAQVT